MADHLNTSVFSRNQTQADEFQESGSTLASKLLKTSFNPEVETVEGRFESHICLILSKFIDNPSH